MVPVAGSIGKDSVHAFLRSLKSAVPPADSGFGEPNVEVDVAVYVKGVAVGFESNENT